MTDAAPTPSHAYDAYAESRFRPDPRRQGVWREIARYLREYSPPEGSVLDLGSGYCDLINSVEARRRYALDRYLDPARFAAPGVTPIVADAWDLSAVPEPLDAVFASNLLEHLSYEQASDVARAVHAALRPGGHWVLVQPNFRYCATTYFDDYTHRTIFTHVGLADFLRAHGFEVARVEARFMPFSLQSRLPAWRPLVRCYLQLPWRPLAKQMLVVGRRPG
ncbi:MAG: class I SAM-dependent methyltransferase [Planctomycetota bacterium]